MERKWLYLHDGETHGPYSVKEIKDLALEGNIWPTDIIWAEGADPRTGVLAEVAVDFSQVPRLPAASAAPPQELPSPQRTAANERELDPVLFVGPEGPKKRKEHRSSKPKKAPKPEAPPLAVVPAPPPLKLVPQPAEEPVVPEPPPESEAVSVAEAAPLMEAVPVMEAIPLAEGLPESVLEAVPVPPNVAAVHEPGISAPERYRRACAALSQWADREDNLPYILAGDTEVICTLPEVLQILSAFQDQPFEVLEKLMEHLDLMVENRSRYYQALEQRGRK